MRLAHACALAATAALGTTARAQVGLVSTDSTGNNFSGDAFNASCSSDGRYVAFQSGSGGLGYGVHVKDRLTGAVTPVSVAVVGPSPVVGNYPSMSADGTVVAFHSGSPTIVLSDTNGTTDIFVRDLAAGITTRISVSSAGAQSTGASFHPSISADGRWVAFQSVAANLVAGDVNNAADIFVHDRASATTTLVSIDASGVGPATGSSIYPVISADGRWVAFESTANDLVLPDTFTSAAEVYTRDLVTGTTFRVSLDSSGAQAKGLLHSQDGLFTGTSGGTSADGRWVAFIGDVGLDANYPTSRGLYLRDVVGSTTRLVSVPPTGTMQISEAEGGSMSSDARYVTFSTRDKLTSDDVNPQIDVFVRDMQLGTTTRMSRELPGLVSGPFQNSGNAVITPDGTSVFFESYSPKLALNDTEMYADVFAFDWSLAAPVAYCTAGVSAQGCAATLSSSGSPSGSAGGGFTLLVGGTDGQRVGLLVYGIAGRQVLPWGTSSFSCVTPPRQRTGLLSTGGTSGQCDGGFGLDWNAFVATHPAALGAPIGELTPIQAQAFVRDPTAPGGSVLSNALEFYAVP